MTFRVQQVNDVVVMMADCQLAEMRRLTLVRTSFDKHSKQTRRAKFLAEMDQVVPWRERCAPRLTRSTRELATAGCRSAWKGAARGRRGCSLVRNRVA